MFWDIVTVYNLNCVVAPVGSQKWKVRRTPQSSVAPRMPGTSKGSGFYGLRAKYTTVVIKLTFVPFVFSPVFVISVTSAVYLSYISPLQTEEPARPSYCITATLNYNIDDFAHHQATHDMGARRANSLRQRLIKNTATALTHSTTWCKHCARIIDHFQADTLSC